MKVAVALLLLGVVAVSAYSELEYQTLFTRWMEQNDKTYMQEEFFTRYNTFKANLDFVNLSNSQNKSYTLAMNKFGDLNTEEFGKMMCGYKPALRTSARLGEAASADVNDLPIDWVTKGAVTPVKDQQQCGSCWAFSATGALEGAYFVAKASLPNLSEQQLVDCAGSFGNQGCNGGLMDYAFDYVKANGIVAENDYRYTARDGACRAAGKTVVTKITSYTDVSSGDENALLNFIQQQPVAIAIEADQACFQFYRSGILDDASCGTNLDHGVLLVGAGTDAGKDYWRVKNSWGASWGDKGFIRFVRGKNQCGLTLAASFPKI